MAISLVAIQKHLGPQHPDPLVLHVDYLSRSEVNSVVRMKVVTLKTGKSMSFYSLVCKF